MLLICKNRYVKTPPAGSVMPKILRVIGLGIKEGFSLSAAEPKEQMEKHSREVPWNEEFVDGVRSALVACQICHSDTTVFKKGKMIKKDKKIGNLTCKQRLRKNKTYSSRDSHVVTHRSTNLPFNCLCMAERTGCPVFS
ncbi:hypothetical protein KCU84_g9795, partial [Aureobasidium melanogenum]